MASLYAFDALCRAARHQAVKQGLTTDSAAEQGNSFTFLKKMEGVLEGLVEDMVTCGASEAKVSRDFTPAVAHSFFESLWPTVQ